jgi:hypothetical protein
MNLEDEVERVRAARLEREERERQAQEARIQTEVQKQQDALRAALQRRLSHYQYAALRLDYGHRDKGVNGVESYAEFLYAGRTYRLMRSWIQGAGEVITVSRPGCVPLGWMGNESPWEDLLRVLDVAEGEE